LNGRVAAVLGVGPGLGSSVARRFASEGFAVALMARGEESVAGAGLPQFPQNILSDTNSLPQFPQYLCCMFSSSATNQTVQEAQSELEHDPSYGGQHGHDEDE